MGAKGFGAGNFKALLNHRARTGIARNAIKTFFFALCEKNQPTHVVFNDVLNFFFSLNM
jgi:hypothetical protein